MKSTVLIVLFIIGAAHSHFVPSPASKLKIQDETNNQDAFSADDECRDTSNKCSHYTHFCSNTTPQNWWVQTHCPKTCGKCVGTKKEIKNFKVKSGHPTYGYLRLWGYHAPDGKNLLEFTTLRISQRYFRFLANGALQNVASGKCVNLYTPTNQQLVLKANCNDANVDKFAYNSATKQLVHAGSKKCLSVWNYLGVAPSQVTNVPGLLGCSTYTTVVLEY